MGTDSIGRDYFSRIIYGARISLIIGFVAQMISLLIGVPLGAIAGFLGGRADYMVMRLVDVMSVFPSLLFAILIMAWLGSGLTNVLFAIGVTGWVGVCRLVRAQFLSLRESDFVRSARSMGASNTRIIVRHMLPNALSPIIVGLAMGIPQAIFAEAGLSFLGLGINPPTPSWGQMVSSHLPNVIYYWHLALFPVFMIALIMLGFSLVGDGLRDALDPRMNE
jgi:ABC-type dipeptide/oligopeptide/nickel transport system permease subunit